MFSVISVNDRMHKKFDQIFGYIEKCSAHDFHSLVLDISKYFLDRPYEYVVDVWVDWQRTHLDLHKIIKVDAFDCMSYVELVLALSLMRINRQEYNIDILWEYLSHIMFSDVKNQAL